MFRRIAADTINGTLPPDSATLSTPDIKRADELFGLHASELWALLESAWSFRLNYESEAGVGYPWNKTELKSMPESLLNLFPHFAENKAKFTFTDNTARDQPLRGGVLWDHLIYAYIIESTQAYRVFHELVRRYAQGDFEINLDPLTLQWLHNTEVLFFSDPPVYTSFNMVSHLRPDMGATRRNAYYRMFGFTLPSDATPGGPPYAFYQPKASNLNFRRNFERFCEEVWIGIENHKVTIGRVPIDDESIAFNAFEMQKSFQSQRNNGDISKQEFIFVSMMSWFHLTLEYNSPIVKAFGINESSPAQRLFALANIVGVPANGLSENLFRLSDPMSLLLTMIETGTFETNVKALYDETNFPEIAGMMRRIIFNYSAVTGTDLKVRQGQNMGAYPLPRGNGIPAGNGQAVAALPG